MKYREYWERIA